jgi:NDP-sugar pyrophosphorylase family protein
MEGYPRRFEGVTIKRGAWVPPDTTILPGVVVGEETIIGTGAVVTKSMPSRVFAVGVPATVTRSVDEIQIKLDNNQKDIRLKEIIGAFKDWIKDTIAVENNNIVDGTEFALIVCMKRLFKVRRWGIYYTTGNISQSLVEKLLSLKDEFANIIIVSLGVVDEEVLKRMIETPALDDFFSWIALENRSCKGNRDHLFPLFRRFLRSHYGVRLETSR